MLSLRDRCTIYGIVSDSREFLSKPKRRTLNSEFNSHLEVLTRTISSTQLTSVPNDFILVWIIHF